MIKDIEPITSKDFDKGLVTRSDFLKGDINASPNTMDVQWNFDASLRKRFGASSTNSIMIGSTSIAGWTIDSDGTLSTNLKAYWKLDEASGNRLDALDGVNLTDKNSTGFVVGIRGQAANMVAQASNSLIVATTAPIETGNVNFSLSSWIYLNSTSTTIEQTIVSKRDPEIDSPTTLLLHAEGTPFVDSSPTAKSVTTSGAMAFSVSAPTVKFGTGAAQFNGLNSYITTPDSDDFFFNADWTIETWCRFSTLAGTQTIYQQATNDANYSRLVWDGSNWVLYVNGTILITAADTLSTNTYYHILVSRKGNNFYIFRDGSQKGTVNNTIVQNNHTGAFLLGASDFNGSLPTTNYLSGWLDEIRVSKGVARKSASFTTAGYAYQVNFFEYWLYVNTNQNATFRVSSTGSNQTSTVQASSFGALTTSTWYNIIAWHSNNSHIGIAVNAGGTNTSNYTSGILVGSAPFVLGAMSDGLAGDAITYLDARQDETGFWGKVLSSQERSDLYGGGTGNTYSPGNSSFGWASFDFGASAIRWYIIAAGSGLYASSNRGTTFIVINTSRTQSYQYLDRSKNVLIATSDQYDTPLYWAGSAGTSAIALAVNSAPAVKFSINYSGFLILLNSSLRKRGFFYADENLQLTDPWTNSFDLPSSADDEITAAFILNKFLYVSTRYRIFRLALVGGFISGSQDWSYIPVKSWGFVPRTVQTVTLRGSENFVTGGQVAIGLDWDRRLRMFDGYSDSFISDGVENDNKMCDFAMNKISYAGSGLQTAHAILNPLTQEYRLNVAIGANSTQTTHALILNARNLAFYPYSNQGWQTMCTAESNNQRALMAVDRSGFVYILDSGNLDGTVAINEVYDSPPLFSKVPEVVSKGKQLNLFFGVTSSGTLNYQDRVDLSNVWSSQSPLSDSKGNTSLLGTESSIKLVRTINTPSIYNTYQFRITSSSGTTNAANPWVLDRLDFLQQGFGIGKGN